MRHLAHAVRATQKLQQLAPLPPAAAQKLTSEQVPKFHIEMEKCIDACWSKPALRPEHASLRQYLRRGSESMQDEAPCKTRLPESMQDEAESRLLRLNEGLGDGQSKAESIQDEALNPVCGNLKWEPNSHGMAKFLLVPPANGQNPKGPFNAQLLGRFVNDVWELQEPNVIISVRSNPHILLVVFIERFPHR